MRNCRAEHLARSALKQPSVTTEFRGSTAIITLNNARQKNSLSLRTLQELEAAFSEADQNQATAIVITGVGDVFSAGANLKELTQLNSVSAVEFSQCGQSVFQKLADAPQLTIAAINGYCMGGGMDLALACDIRVASRNAKLSHPGSRRGIITGWGGTQRLSRLIGRTRSLEMFIAAGMYSSEEAFEMGLVTAIGDPVLETALKISADYTDYADLKATQLN